MGNNDQFKWGMLPLRPKSYTDRAEAQCNEILIDYEGDKSYHIYIVDSEDRTKYIDITQKIITDGFPTINADNFKITIENSPNAWTLKELLNRIFVNYLKPEDRNGFVYEEDLSKVMDEKTKDILLTDEEKNIYLPVTLTRNILDSSGQDLETILNSITRVGFSTSYVRATMNNQTSFEITYPFINYPTGGNYMEIRIGSTYIDKSRYEVINETNSSNEIYGATINFLDESVELGRAVNILYIYNSKSATGGTYEYMSGGLLADGSTPISKMEKVSDSFILADSTSVATSKALYNMYGALMEAIESSSNNVHYGVYSISSTGEQVIKPASGTADIGADELKTGTTVLAKMVNMKIPSNAKFYIGGKNVPLCDEYGNSFTSDKVLNGNILKFIYIDGYMYVYGIDAGYGISTNRYVYTADDQETCISYSGLAHESYDQIFVYRNGARLFEGIDYALSPTLEQITLYVRTEANDKFVFESYKIARRV